LDRELFLPEPPLFLLPPLFFEDFALRDEVPDFLLLELPPLFRPADLARLDPFEPELAFLLPDFVLDDFDPPRDLLRRVAPLAPLDFLPLLFLAPPLFLAEPPRDFDDDLLDPPLFAPERTLDFTVTAGVASVEPLRPIDLPAIAPTTPPTIAPTGPATLPTNAPVAAPAVDFEIGGM